MTGLPERLKWYRENLKDHDSKWTQKYVADKIGVARVTYTAYENGTKTPPPDIISKLADLFDASTDYLLGRTDNPDPHNKVTVAGHEITLTREELKVFEELKKHPIMFNDLASDPEKKIKELIKLYKMKKMFFEEDDEEYGVDGFGDLED